MAEFCGRDTVPSTCFYIYFVLRVREVDIGRDFSFFFLLEIVKLDVTITGLLVICPLCFPSADKSPLRCMIVFKSSILLPVTVVIGVCF